MNAQKPLAMSLSYAAESDALVIYLVDPERLPKPCFPSHTKDGIFIIDVDANDKILSIEVLDARNSVEKRLIVVWSTKNAINRLIVN